VDIFQWARVPFAAFTRQRCPSFLIIFFNDTATTEIYTLSLHDALPISRRVCTADYQRECQRAAAARLPNSPGRGGMFSLEGEEALRFLICSRLFTDDEHAALESAGRV